MASAVFEPGARIRGAADDLQQVAARRAHLADLQFLGLRML
jgi:hypothetical protein